MGLGAAEPLHVDVLARHRAHDVWSGDEDAAVGAEDDDVGQRRPVGSAAGRGPEHDRDLRNAAGRPGHDVEDLAHRVQRDDAFGEPRAAGVPQADNGDLVGQGPCVRGHDDLAALGAHGAAHDRGVGREGDGMRAVHQAVTGEHAGVAVGGERHVRTVVEESAKTLVGVARVVFAGDLRLLDGRGRLLGGGHG